VVPATEAVSLYPMLVLTAVFLAWAALFGLLLGLAAQFGVCLAERDWERRRP
jgi:hypothetical protein